MSKINPIKFDSKELGINKAIDEQIGVLKGSRINYTRNQRSSKSKNSVKSGDKMSCNKSKNKYQASPKRQENNNYPRIHSKKVNHNGSSKSSISNSKEKKNLNILRAKIYKKNDYAQVERVVIDLVSQKSEAQKSEISINNRSEKSMEYLLDNKDNNICSSIGDAAIATNMVQSRWKNNCNVIKTEVINCIADELYKKKKEIEFLVNRWKNNQKIIKEDKLSIYRSYSIQEKWKKNEKIQNIVNWDFSVDEKEIKRKKIKEILDKWNQQLRKMKDSNFSFFPDEVKVKQKEMNDFINRWKNDIKTIYEENIEYTIDELKKSKTDKSTSVMYKLLDPKEFKKENIILSFNSQKEADTFKYSEKEYIQDLVKNLYMSDNNKKIFFILNLKHNLNSINYKAIEPKDKKELEQALYDYYNDNKNNLTKLNKNKSNNSEISLTKETYINPIFILNEDQLKELYDQYTNHHNIINMSDDLSNANIIVKSGEIKFDAEKKNVKDFEQTTPLGLLYNKCYILAVTRYIKYSVQSPQAFVTYLGEGAG